MLAFSIAFLIVVVARTPLPPVGIASAAGIGAALAALVPPLRISDATRERCVGASLGAVAALLLPAAAPPPSRPAVDPFDPGQVVRCEGTVDSDGRLDPIGASFRLTQGPRVRVRSMTFLPLSGTRLAVVGRLDASGRTLSAESAEAVTFLDPPPALSLRTLAANLREWCRGAIRHACDPPTAGFLLALLIGDPGLPPSARDDLVRTGTLHLIAVSGTHLSLFLAGLRLVTRRARVSIPLLVAYALVCGLQPPVLRSLVLAIGHVLGRRMNRASDQAGMLPFSACVVLAFDRGALFDVGFQLSFAAYAGLVWFRPPSKDPDPFEAARLRSWHGRMAARLRPALWAGIGATLLTSPISASGFHRLAPVGILATLALSPLIPMLLWLAVAIVVFPDLRPLSILARAIVEGVLFVADLWARIPFVVFDVPRLDARALGVLWFFVIVLTVRWFEMSRATKTVGLLGIVACLAATDRAPPGLYQLDAGAGAATLLVDDRVALLVDTGPIRAHTAEQILALGIGRIDVLALTHGHEDHVGGLAEVTGRLRVLRTLVTRASSRWATRLQLPAEVVRRGDVLAAGANTIEVLHPTDDSDFGPNDGSLVLRLYWCGRHILLMGDLETDGLRNLLEQEPLDPVDGLLLPHHGSANDHLGELLARTRPAWVVLAARPGFAADSTGLLVEWIGATLRATATEGVVALPFERQHGRRRPR